MRSICLFLLFLYSLTLSAANTTTKQSTTITSSVTVSTATDYTITASTPFSGSGSVNITNTDHAAVIFKSVKPSVVISTWLKYIKIKGAAAVDGTNCQVKMYDCGSIILPYASDIKPLTCYTSTNYGGTSCSDYGLGNTGGYMNTLSDSQLKNNIRSFKLKRGYMVTFAVGTAGWGYSRCFIADTEDLEMSTLPAVLSGKISSYRIFKWQDAKKSGLANDITSAANSALNTSWCYNFNIGSSMTPDQECVPHRIQIYWPSITDIGKTTYSANMKTDNEPGNSSDDNPATVAQVLGYWQDVMRTGMRLCSPSTHDGGYSWLKEFMTAIDERGWRCDVVDLHCYWDTGSFTGTSLQNTYNTYGRPIWISEMLYGASWNSNGVFAKVSDPSSNSDANQTANYNGGKTIVDKLNTYGYVERYAWWNSESVCSKVYYNSALTKMGSYYATMDPGIGYNKKYEFVPKVVISTPDQPTVTFQKGQLVVSWTDANGDMVDAIKVQYRKGTGSWTTLGTVTPTDKTGSSSVSYKEYFTKPSDTEFEVRVVDTYDGTEYPSTSASVTLSSGGFITAFPTNYDEFYYVIYSAETATPRTLCWTLGWNGNKTDISYQGIKEVGTELTQIWQIEANSSSTGYSLRNLAAHDYVMCSPNSWNFTTNNDSYHISAAKTGYLPEYHSDGSDGYWTIKNCGYNDCYVGLWDNDKIFAVGERLAGNRTLATSDHLTLYAIPKQDFSRSYLPACPENSGYLMDNPNFTWGTYESPVMGSNHNYVPYGWSFEKDFSGWNDSNVAAETINGVSTQRFNTWAGTFRYADIYQDIYNLPNGYYSLSADLATTSGNSPYVTKTALYANPGTAEYAARSYDIVGTGNSDFQSYKLYVYVNNHVLRIGARSDGTWFKVANFKLQYYTTYATTYIKRELSRYQALQLHHEGKLSDVNLDLTTDANDATAITNILLQKDTDKGVADQDGNQTVTLRDLNQWVQSQK